MMGEVVVYEVEVCISLGIGFYCCLGDNVNIVDFGVLGIWINYDIVVEDNVIDDVW